MTRTVFLLAMIFSGSAHALSSDREQPAVIEADEVEMDFTTGVRTYKGNVTVNQGTLRISGDKLVVKVNDDSMESATAWGNPATFRQRPDGKDNDVEGKGRKIVLNDTKNTLTLIRNASLTQGGQTAAGNVIVYDMGRNKMTVKGLKGAKQAQKDDAGKEKKGTGRSRIIIMPRKKSTP